MTSVTTHESWQYSGISVKGSGRTAHKIPLVSPSMDVDVTGYSIKNVGMHLIDHPRDDGQKHREQLWSFQQKYRGATILRFRGSASSDADDRTSNDSTQEDQTTDSDSRAQSMPRRSSGEHSSLPSRFKKRLNQRHASVNNLKSSDSFNDTGRSKSGSQGSKDDERQQQMKIQRLYSSGSIVKNNLYNQLRQGEGKTDDDQTLDNSKIVESLQKYGPGLERLPDIQYPGSKSEQYSNRYKFYKTVCALSTNPLTTKSFGQKTFSLRRSFTNINDLGPSKIKLRLVERRKDECSYNKVNGDSVDNTEPDENNCQQADDDDECDNENSVCRAERFHDRGYGQKHPVHVDIRQNVTHINTQDDSSVPYYHENDETKKENLVLREERTFCAATSKGSQTDRSKYMYKRTDLNGKNQTENYDKYVESGKSKHKVKQSWSNSSDLKSVLNKDNKALKRVLKKTETDTNQDDGSESDNSLDIPEDRYGHTTHSIDKKLAIRKPWEWRPSPFRWIDRPFVKESDKPYIERIINSGEIIDEYNYDSFARTKPLKLHDFPEGAGYKDRSGVLR